MVGAEASVRWTSLSRALRPISVCDLTIRLVMVSTEAFRPQASEYDRSSCGSQSLCDALIALHRWGPRALDNVCQDRLWFYRAFPTRQFASTGRDFAFRKLSFVVSFNDCYTKATHAHVVDEIFEMCEGLAINAKGFGITGQVKAVADYTQKQQGGGARMVHREDEWMAETTSDDA